MHSAQKTAAALLCCLIATGCATVAEIPEQPYPAGWPQLVGKAADCSNIEGEYVDLGIAAGSGPGHDSVSLAGMLSNAPPASASTVAIAITGGNEIVLTLFDSSGASRKASLKRKSVFACESGTAKISWSNAALEMAATFIEEQAIHLFKAADGSLVVNKRYRGQGYFFFVPFSDKSSTWIRFESASGQNEAATHHAK